MKFAVRLFSLLLIVLLICAGVFAAGKLHAMYRNVWDELDSMSAAIDEIQERTKSLPEIDDKVEHLHRDAFFTGNDAHPDFDYSWVEEVPHYIAHACGGIDETMYTNSREAFMLNYELGHRVFEVDFNLSEDGVLIASHDENLWRNMTGTDLPYTSGHFNDLPICGRYESLTCAEIIDLMAQYPDVYIVTDTKDQEEKAVMLAFSQLIHCAEKTHPEVLDRIIPQIYHEEMLSWITAIYPFRSVIFTLYSTTWWPDYVLDFCRNSGIRYITMPYNLATEEAISLWKTMDIYVAVHTVNDQDEIERFFDMGVDMIYTDYAVPD